MPNQRAPGQKLITVPMNEDFISRIDHALPGVGYGDRSSFIRDAIVEKLAKDGVKIPPQMAAPPLRSGKRRLSSSESSSAKGSRGADAALAQRLARESGSSRSAGRPSARKR